MAIQFVTTEAVVDYSSHERFNALLEEQFKNAGMSEKAVKGLADSIAKQAAKIREVETLIKLEEKASKQLRQELAKSNDGKQQEKLKKELVQNESILKALRKEAQNLGADFQKIDTADRPIRETTGLLSNLFSIAGGFSLASVFQSGVSAVKNYAGEIIDVTAQVEQLEKTLEAVASGQNIDPLLQQARELGANTEFSTSQVIQAQIEAVKLGRTAPEVEKATAAILDYSTATKDGAGNSIELNTATEIAVSGMNALGIEAERSREFLDLLLFAQNNSALSAERFAEANKTAGPAVRAVNVESEAYLATLGATIGAGLRASTVGRGYSNILGELSDGNSKLSQFLGIVVNDTDSYIEAIRRLSDSDLTLAQSTELVGSEFNELLLTLGNTGDQIISLTDDYQNVSGAAARAAATIRDSLVGAQKEQESAAEGLSLAIGDRLNGAYLESIKLTTELTRRLTDFVEVKASEREQDRASNFEVSIGVLERYTSQLEELRGQSELTQSQQNELARVEGAYSDLIGEINSQYETYLPNLIKEGASLADIREISEQVNESFRTRINLLLVQEDLQANQEQALDIQRDLRQLDELQEKARQGKISFTEILQINRDINQGANLTSTALVSAFQASTDSGQAAAVAQIEVLQGALRLQFDEITAQNAELINQQSVFQDEFSKTSAGQKEASQTTTTLTQNIEQQTVTAEETAVTIATLRKRLEELKTFRDTKINVETYRETFDRVTAEINALDKQIKALTGSEIRITAESAAKLKEEVAKLRLQAEIELAGGADSVEGLEILAEEAVRKLEETKAFQALDLSEQQALVNAKTAEFAAKISETYAKQVEEALAQEETAVALAINRISRAAANADLDLTTEFQINTDIIANQLQRGEISYEQYTTRRKELEEELETARLENERTFLASVIETNRLALQSSEERITALRTLINTAPEGEDTQEAQAEIDARIQANQELRDALSQSEQELADFQVQITADRVDREIEEEQRGAEARAALREQFISASQQALSSLNSLFVALEARKIAAVEARVSKTEEAQNASDERRLAAAAGNEEELERIQEEIARRKVETEKRTELEISKIRRQAAIKEKVIQVAQATINGLVAVSKVLANPVLAAIVAAASALNVAATIATPIPQFRTGVYSLGDKPAEKVKGPGTGTSDSILARIANGESIISAQNTQKYNTLVEGLVNGTIKRHKVNNTEVFTTNNQSFPELTFNPLVISSIVESLVNKTIKKKLTVELESLISKNVNISDYQNQAFKMLQNREVIRQINETRVYNKALPEMSPNPLMVAAKEQLVKVDLPANMIALQDAKLERHYSLEAAAMTDEQMGRLARKIGKANAKNNRPKPQYPAKKV